MSCHANLCDIYSVSLAALTSCHLNGHMDVYGGVFYAQLPPSFLRHPPHPSSISEEKEEMLKIASSANGFLSFLLTNFEQHLFFGPRTPVANIAAGNYSLAFSYLDQAEAVWSKKIGKRNNINAATTQVLKGDIYYKQKNS